MLQKLRNLWKKNTSLTIEFSCRTTKEDDVAHFLPPAPASHYIPDWYKKISKNVRLDLTGTKYDSNDYDYKKHKEHVICRSGKVNTTGTVKTCMPMRDMLTTGYIVPLWVDWAAEINFEKNLQNFSWTYPCTWEVISTHHRGQFEGCPVEKNVVNDTLLKLNCPWRFKTPPGYSTLFIPPPVRELKFEIVPAIVDTDTQHEVNFPFSYVGPDGDYVISKGEPLILAIPFKREKWSHIVRAETEKEMNKDKLQFSTSLHSFYRNNRWHKKVFR